MRLIFIAESRSLFSWCNRTNKIFYFDEIKIRCPNCLRSTVDGGPAVIGLAIERFIERKCKQSQWRERWRLRRRMSCQLVRTLIHRNAQIEHFDFLIGYDRFHIIRLPVDNPTVETNSNFIIAHFSQHTKAIEKLSFAHHQQFWHCHSCCRRARFVVRHKLIK